MPFIGRQKFCFPVLSRVRITVIGDAKLTDRLRRWRGIIDITLNDGRRLAHRTLAAKGSAEDPLTRTEEEEKALDLVQPALGRVRARRLLDALWRFEQLGDVRTLHALTKA